MATTQRPALLVVAGGRPTVAADVDARLAIFTARRPFRPPRLRRRHGIRTGGAR